MNGEYPFNANTVGNTANGKCFGNTGALASDYDTFKSLKSFSFTFTDFNLYLNCVADFDCLRYVLFKRILRNEFKCVHFIDLPKFSGVHTAYAAEDRPL